MGLSSLLRYHFGKGLSFAASLLRLGEAEAIGPKDLTHLQMAQTSHFPGTTIIREGFWRSTEEPDLPLPSPAPATVSVSEEFISALTRVEEIIREYHSPPESIYPVTWQREKIRRYFGEDRTPFWLSQYRGWSDCRLCPLKENGDSEFELTIMGTTYIWPEGYRHYLTEHHVLPTPGFERFILDLIPKGLSALASFRFTPLSPELCSKINQMDFYRGGVSVTYS